jgi:hypothetical protein
MAIKADPGSMVEVTVKRTPRRQAAVKTLTRLFRKDARHQEEIARLKESRPFRTHIRGGRPWEDRPAQLLPFRIEKGASCRIEATIDVIRDLNSVESDIEVKPVK